LTVCVINFTYKIENCGNKLSPTKILQLYSWTLSCFLFLFLYLDLIFWCINWLIFVRAKVWKIAFLFLNVHLIFFLSCICRLHILPLYIAQHWKYFSGEVSEETIHYFFFFFYNICVLWFVDETNYIYNFTTQIFLHVFFL
jgi:hypothetical protein